MRKNTWLAVTLTSSLLLIGANTESISPAPNCKHAKETESLALTEFEQLKKSFDKTTPFTPEREVAGAKVMGVIRLLDNVKDWMKDNCSES